MTETIFLKNNEGFRKLVIEFGGGKYGENKYKLYYITKTPNRIKDEVVAYLDVNISAVELVLTKENIKLEEVGL